MMRVGRGTQLVRTHDEGGRSHKKLKEDYEEGGGGGGLSGN